MQDRKSQTSTGPATTTGKTVRLDTANMYAEQVGREGVTRADLGQLDLANTHAEVAAKAQGGLDAEYAALNLGAAMLPSLPAILQMAGDLRRFSDVVVIGIGGSSLGAKAGWQALRAPFPAEGPQLHFVENVDPYELNQLLVHLEPATTGIICISKSGGTVETIVQYLVLREWLAEGLGREEALAHQWIVTDPASGWLRRLAEQEGVASLPVPPHIGGRYSVLSAVGLLPLAVIGIDVTALLHGAAANASRCASDDPTRNPALEMAALYYLGDAQKGKRVSIMMPYVNRLRLFVDWYCQLWAESLGKRREGRDPAGTLPIRAMGAIDQHSQLQMYLESRHDKMFSFIELARWENDISIPLREREQQHFPYLKDRTLAEVIHAEFIATRQVITDTGHPNLTITLPTLDAHVLGQLIDLYQRTTIYAAHFYGINPLDQPAVEQGKKLAVKNLSSRG